MSTPDLQTDTSNTAVQQCPPCPMLGKDHRKWLIENHMVSFIQNKEQAQVKSTTGKPVRGPGVKYMRKFVLNDFINAFWPTRMNQIQHLCSRCVNPLLSRRFSTDSFIESYEIFLQSLQGFHQQIPSRSTYTATSFASHQCQRTVLPWSKCHNQREDEDTAQWFRWR